MVKFYQGVILVLVGIILFLRFCNRPAPCPDQQVIKTDTVTKRDTVWIEYNSGSQVSYTPKVKETIPFHYNDQIIDSVFKNLVARSTRRDRDTIHFQQIDPGEDDETIGIDTNFMTLRQFKQSISTHIYSDTLQTGYGPVVVNDTLQYNRIKKRGWTSNLSLPIITEEKTITKTVEEEKKLRVYGGFQLVGRPELLVSDFGPSITIITKREQLYGGSVLWNPKGGWGASIESKWLLSFRNKKQKR